METPQQIAANLISKQMRIHLIGVAGSGMSGIAGLLLALGHKVSGSDKVSTVEVERLRKLGLEFFCPQAAHAVHGKELVIYSSAIKPGNAEYDEAAKLKLPMVRRAEALASIMECKKGVVIAGMHGKTTTSSMAAHVLRVGGVKPSHYVGAEIPILGTNAHWDGEGDFLVAEGDESDGTLSLYRPEHAIILNIEEEHLDFYSDLAAIEAVYRKFADQTRGHLFYCADDLNAARLCNGRPHAISYGEHVEADYRFQVVLSKAFRSQFKVFCRGAWLGDFTLNVPGKHNISNATAVVALACELGVPVEKIAEAFESFRGARRRFEVKYRSDNYMVVDDYGHHPSEIQATIATARAVGRQRVVVVFQPHRYTRTLALKEQFGTAFEQADAVFVADVYPASEKPIEGVSGQTIVDAVTGSGQIGAVFQPERRQIPVDVARILKPGDLVLSLGAGDIHEQGTALAHDLARLEELEGVMREGTIKLYEPLSKHTTMRVGGPAQFWAEPETEAAMVRLIRHCSCNNIPFMIIGRGSNLLVRDGGIPGVVIHPARGDFKKVEIRGELVTAGVGVKLKDLAYAARDAVLGGFEWMEGIPGNVGGGLRMNAGAMGAETFDDVVSIRFVNDAGEVHEASPAELDVHYRDARGLAKNYALSATFRGKPSTREDIERLLKESQQKRRTSQPAASSAGCIFKNPAASPAGKLVDELGLKNMNVGKARVSEVHGNFIVNEGGASAREVLELISRIQAKALAERGIVLETEVQIVGQDGHLHG